MQQLARPVACAEPAWPTQPVLAACPARQPPLARRCRPADPGYTAGDAEDGPDPLQVALASKESYQHVRALPAEAGGAVVFTHRCAFELGACAMQPPGNSRHPAVVPGTMTSPAGLVHQHRSAVKWQRISPGKL